MVHTICDSPAIFCIDIPLPDNPLQNLNVYVLQSEGETLVVDTGFRRPECARALLAGLEQLGVSLADTTLFVTHLHSDHIGLAGLFVDAGARVLMGRDEYRYWNAHVCGRSWADTMGRLAQEGFPRDELEKQHLTNPAVIYAPQTGFPVTELEDGARFSIGAVELQCIQTPGHTPFHMCLYIPAEQIMFLGDHVLFDISPNIGEWEDVDDSLGDYLRSLDAIAALPMRLALPAHRAGGQNVYQRIERIKAHHTGRLENILSIMDGAPGQTAYQIASQMRWKMRGAGWEDFPVTQKWFAVGETFSHLDLLLQQNRITKAQGTNFFVYSLATAN